MDSKWLQWARLIKSWAQTGIFYSGNPYDIERYEKYQDLASEIIADYSDHDMPHVKQVLDQETGPGTPKVDVRGVVFKDDAILMVREIGDHNRWTLPGGWADVNDTPSRTTEREVFEESGYETHATKLLAVYDKTRHDHPPDIFYVYKLFFLCEITGGTATTSLETSEVRFFKEAELPSTAELSDGRVTVKQLHRMFEFYRNPDLPTDFD